MKAITNFIIEKLNKINSKTVDIELYNSNDFTKYVRKNYPQLVYFSIFNIEKFLGSKTASKYLYNIIDNNTTDKSDNIVIQYIQYLIKSDLKDINEFINKNAGRGKKLLSWYYKPRYPENTNLVIGYKSNYIICVKKDVNNKFIYEIFKLVPKEEINEKLQKINKNSIVLDECNTIDELLNKYEFDTKTCKYIKQKLCLSVSLWYPDKIISVSRINNEFDIKAINIDNLKNKAKELLKLIISYLKGKHFSTGTGIVRIFNNDAFIHRIFIKHFPLNVDGLENKTIIFILNKDTKECNIYELIDNERNK